MKFFFNFPFKEILSERQRTKIAHASSEYRKVKCVLRDNILFWYIFMDVLFHRFLEHF